MRWLQVQLVIGTMFTVSILSSFTTRDEESVYVKEMQATMKKRPSPAEVGSNDQCLYTQDYGLLDRLANSSQTFCTGASDSSPFSFYSIPEVDLKATQLSNFVLDMRNTRVSREIASLFNDGIDHDPRFKYAPGIAFCTCAGQQDGMHGVPNIWSPHLDGFANPTDPVCQFPLPDTTDREMLTLSRAVIVARRDDHNPFFQISTIFNAWIMMNVIGWDRGSTQLVTLDRGLPSPVDDLRHAVLGPERPVIDGETFQHQAVHLESALVAPYEATGPLMSHLDDDQPCFDNALIADFRDVALNSMGVVPIHTKTDPQRCLVTIISRRPYGGRRVQRVWQNEDIILQLMRNDYKDAYQFGECEFQALDFVNMTMPDQMRVMIDSDIVIGMHGAGMVNVMWTRPETLVIEIFPRFRKRWGYRNLCQYLGCSWHDFRGGRDVFVRTTDPNGMDKSIPYMEWKRFFDPLFRGTVSKLENSASRTSLRH